MKGNRSGNWFALAFGALMVCISAGAATNGRPVVASTAAVARVSDVLAIEREGNGKLLAVGRLDSISSSEFIASVLGQTFVLLGSRTVFQFVEHAEVGQAVAFFGELIDDQYFVDAAIVLPGGYVQGASNVFLQGHLNTERRSVGTFSVGTLELDVASLSIQNSVAGANSGSLATFIGSQPSISGKVLVERFARVKSVERSRADASLGTGRPNASVGTGRPNASVGTGRPNASVRNGSAYE